jgi:carboxylesterase type B
MGQSAGGWSVDFFNYAYPDDPIVSGLIAESGVAQPLSEPDPSNFTQLAASVGCEGLSADEELQCMQEVNTARLKAATADILSAVPAGATYWPFSPKADDVTAFSNYTERLEQGIVAQIV